MKRGLYFSGIILLEILFLSSFVFAEEVCRPSNIMLVIDTSISMNEVSSGKTLIEIAKDSAKLFVNNVSKSSSYDFHKIGIVTFSNVPVLNSELKSVLLDYQEIITSIDSIQTTYAGTNLPEGIIKASEELDKAPSDENKYIIVLSDGASNYRCNIDDICYDAYECAVRQAEGIKGKDIEIYGIGIGEGAIDSSRNLYGTLPLCSSNNPRYFWINPYSLLKEVSSGEEYVYRVENFEEISIKLPQIYLDIASKTVCSPFITILSPERNIEIERGEIVWFKAIADQEVSEWKIVIDEENYPVPNGYIALGNEDSLEISSEDLGLVLEEGEHTITILALSLEGLWGISEDSNFKITLGDGSSGDGDTGGNNGGSSSGEGSNGGSSGTGTNGEGTSIEGEILSLPFFNYWSLIIALLGIITIYFLTSRKRKTNHHI